jgi:hypothetical protein
LSPAGICPRKWGKYYCIFHGFFKQFYPTENNAGFSGFFYVYTKPNMVIPDKTDSR